jgi:hypothetical protein
MRLLLPILAIMAATPADARRGVTSPDGRRRAERVGNTVLVDGDPVWRGRGVVSPLVWSTRGDALAFTARDRAGRHALIVLVVPDDAQPAALSWPIPRAARPARAVTWLGPTRLGAGPTVLDPKVVASFAVHAPARE